MGYVGDEGEDELCPKNRLGNVALMHVTARGAVVRWQ